MGNRIIGDGKISCCVVFLVASLISGSGSVFAQTRTPAFVITSEGGTGDLTAAERREVRMDITLYALSSDKDDHNYGLVGMPVRVCVSINNGSLTENGEERPQPVAVVSNWTDQVSFDVRVPDGTVMSNATAQFLPYAYRWSTNKISDEEAASGCLSGNWVIDEAAIARAEGDSVVSARWRGVLADEKKTVTVRAPVGDAENAKIRLAKTWVSHGMGAFDKALSEYDAIISAHGKILRFDECWVLERKGDALGAANRLQEALEVYRECVAILEEHEHRGHAFNSLDFKIGILEDAIAKMRLEGAK